MSYANVLRAIVFAIASAYIIFTQDHSVVTGASALEFMGAALTLAGGAMMLVPALKVSKRVLLAPTILSFLVAYIAFMNGEFATATDGAMSLRLLTTLFIFGIAGNELYLLVTKEPTDVLELRISVAIGLLATLVFLLIPMDAVNTVGVLSAYLAISAVQRAIWLFSSKGTTNG